MEISRRERRACSRQGRDWLVGLKVATWGMGQEPGKGWEKKRNREALNRRGGGSCNTKHDLEGCGQMSREARDDPEFLTGVPERLVGLLPGIGEPWSSHSGSFALRKRKAKPTSYGSKEGGWSEVYTGLGRQLVLSCSPSSVSHCCVTSTRSLPSLSSVPSPVN